MQVPCSNCKKECLSELAGTWALVLAGPASVVLTASLSRAESLPTIALTFSGVVALVILIAGRYSGAVINPAVSIAAMGSGNLKKGLLLPYLFFQITGGMLAGVTLRVLFSSPFDKTSLGSTKLTLGIDPLTGILLEAVGTFCLASSALVSGSLFKREAHRAALVGSTLFLLIILIGPLTGASFNPARSLGPALASGYFSNLYVYLIGPSLGGLLAGIVFRLGRDGIGGTEK